MISRLILGAVACWVVGTLLTDLAIEWIGKRVAR